MNERWSKNNTFMYVYIGEMTIYMNRTELANYLGVDPRTIATMIADKKVIPVEIKKVTRYILTKDLFVYLADGEKD
jgi:hypothetical protein